MKSELKKQAQDLRRQGYLFAEIAVKLNISRSTAQIWTHTLEFTEAEIAAAPALVYSDGQVSVNGKVLA